MNLAKVVPILITVSIVLVSLGFGLKARWSDATSFLRHPRELLRAFFVMNIVMLLFAIVIIKLFWLHPAVRLALIVLALSPVPPFLPGTQFKAGGDRAYIYGLLTGMSLITIVAVPLLVPLVGRLFDRELYVSPAAVAKVLFVTILIPLGVGILFHSWNSALSKRAAKWVSMLGNLMLIIAGSLILFGAWRSIVSLIGNGTILAIAAFAAVGLIGGHLLGGPDPERRTSLALATASRHPAVALAIATATFPNEKRVFAAVLLYLIIANLVTIPYLKWHKHHPGSPHEPGFRWRHHPA